jgi:hypothetical protein
MTINQFLINKGYHSNDQTITMGEMCDLVNEWEDKEKVNRRQMLIDFSSWVSMIGEQFFDPDKTAEDMVDIFLNKSKIDPKTCEHKNITR